MSTRAKYWTLTCLGWGAYSAVGAGLTLYLSGLPATPVIAGYGLFFLYSIGLTELFRQVMKRGRWLEPPTRLLWLRLPLSVLLIASIQFALVISISRALMPGVQAWDATSSVSLAWGVLLTTGIWTGLYVRLTEKRRRQEHDAKLQLAVREAELRALQYQINPHFLFNCLNSIRGLVVENPPRAQEMVTRLASLLRHNLQRDANDTVPLASEIEAVTDYLALEAVRFEERLRVRTEIDPAAAQALVPPMLLQTLVENAVKHGIARESAGGEIEIRAARERGSLRVDVSSTGQLGEPNPNGVGLANARERLRLLYGERASLALANGGGRVIATVRLPS
jgi:signal transduction histidine kinase